MRKKTITLSPKRLALLNYIETYQRQHKYAPSIRELCDAVNVSSTSVLSYDLGEMKKTGLLDWVKGQSRTVHVTSAGEEYLTSHRFEAPKKVVNVAVMLNSKVS